MEIINAYVPERGDIVRISFDPQAGRKEAPISQCKQTRST
jgi:hypothetical protein